MVSGSAAPVSAGRSVSQCADAIRIARGEGSRRPSAAQTSPAAPASSACIGEPWEMNRTGSFGTVQLYRVCLGTAGKGSLLLDLSKRTRDLQFGPVSGYLHVQYFNGYGEDILDYNFRRRSQLRVGFAIVP